MVDILLSGYFHSPSAHEIMTPVVKYLAISHFNSCDKYYLSLPFHLVLDAHASGLNSMVFHMVVDFCFTQARHFDC